MKKPVSPPPKIDDARLAQLKQAVQRKWIDDQVTVERAWFDEVWFFLQILGYEVTPPEDK